MTWVDWLILSLLAMICAIGLGALLMLFAISA